MINRLIKTEKDHNHALKRIELLMHAETGSPEADELELLATLVELYEEQHYSMDFPDSVDAIRFRMEQMGMKQQDLIPFIGSRSKVSEVLNHKKPLTLSMMRALHKGLGIPAEVLLQEPGADFPETLSNLEWSRFPVLEMAKRGWIPMMDGIRDRAEEVMHHFVEKVGGFEVISPALLRQSAQGRLNAKADTYAVSAWCLRVASIAIANPLETPYRKEKLSHSTLKDIARLSYFKNGPQLAREYLSRQGIHLIVVPHLSKTYLDGGAMLLPNKQAAICLTLRHDRLDNFWFCLMHELVHVAHHLSKGCRLIVDDLDLRKHTNNDDQKVEKEADEMASEALIPKRYWTEMDNEKTPSAIKVSAWAEKLKVHPAVVAGRIRFKRNNYRIMSNLVGLNQVRRLFPEYAEEEMLS